MAIPDAAALFEKASAQLREKQAELGLGNDMGPLTQVGDVAESIAKEISGLSDKASGQLKAVSEKLAAALEDPASLGVGGGVFAMCMGYVLQQAIKTLKEVKADGEALVTHFTELVKSAPSMEGNPAKGIAAALEKLKALPESLTAAAKTVKTPKDFADFDVEGLLKLVDASIWKGPLDELRGLKGKFDSCMAIANQAVDKLVTFQQEAPGKVQSAMQPCGCSSAPMPPALAEVNEKLELVKSLDLSSMKGLLSKAGEAFSKLDLDALQKPMDDFAKAAQDALKPVADGQKLAKMASGGMMGSVMGALHMGS